MTTARPLFPVRGDPDLSKAILPPTRRRAAHAARPRRQERFREYVRKKRRD